MTPQSGATPGPPRPDEPLRDEARPDEFQADPAQAEPAHADPVHADPVHADPVRTDPAPPLGIQRALQDALRGAYRVTRELGSGGMGTVFLAEDLRHARQVAIKVLRPEVAAEMGTERFLREVRIAALLQHPNVLGLIDSGEAGGLLYYVMPYVEGSSLRVRLAREGELPIADAVRILRELAEALAYAHGRGIVHRDVKPENVLFMAGHAQLADFGVAKALLWEAAGRLPAPAEGGRDAVLTQAGVAIGSPGYMAPEALAGDLNDQRVDVYSFGVLAYELLAGEHPFAGGGFRQLAHAHLLRQATPLSEVRASTAGELSELVMRCLEKRPADRVQSMAEVARALEALLATPAATALGGRRHELVAGRFRLSEGVCSRLGGIL